MGVAVGRGPDAGVPVPVPGLLEFEARGAVVPPELPGHRVGRVAGLVGAVVGDVIDPVELMQVGDVGGVEVALHRLHPVARGDLLGRHELGCVVPLGAEVPERRHRLPGTHVGPDDPAGLVGGVRPHPHLVAERLRLAGHVHASPVGVERPPVVNAAQGGALVAPEVQGRAAVRAVLLQQPHPPGAVPVGDQVLAQQPDPGRRAPRLGDLGRQAGRRPVAAEQLAHQRPRTHPGQDLVLFRPQHAAPPPDPDQFDPRPLSTVSSR